jgi:hypothetical protein
MFPTQQERPPHPIPAQVLTPPWPGVAEAMWKRRAVIGGNVGVSVISSLKANCGRHARGGDRCHKADSHIGSATHSRHLRATLRGETDGGGFYLRSYKRLLEGRSRGAVTEAALQGPAP